MSYSLPSDFASHRAPCLAHYRLRDGTQLHEAWQRSRETLRSIEMCLQAAELDSSVQTVCVSGSLGRMELVEQSDVDLIVVVQSDRDANEDTGPKRLTHRATTRFGCLERN